MPSANVIIYLNDDDYSQYKMNKTSLNKKTREYFKKVLKQETK